MKKVIKIKNVVVVCRRRPHGYLLTEDPGGGDAARFAARLSLSNHYLFDQAALAASIRLTFFAPAPSIAMRRGFMASGISR